MIVPLTAWQKTYGTRNSLSISVASIDQASFETAQEEARAILRARRGVAPGKPDDFGIVTAETFMELYRNFTSARLHRAGRRGRHLAGRRRHRDHEHHAGVGHRAHARDRHPQGARAPAAATSSCSSSSRRPRCRSPAGRSASCSASPSRCSVGRGLAAARGGQRHRDRARPRHVDRDRPASSASTRRPAPRASIRSWRCARSRGPWRAFPESRRPARACSARSCSWPGRRSRRTSCARCSPCSASIIGVSTVIAMVSLIQGLNTSMANQIQSFGSNTIYIRKWRPQVIIGQLPDSCATAARSRSGTATRSSPGARRCAPSRRSTSSTSSRRSATGKLATKPTFVLGTDQAYQETNGYDVAAGPLLHPARGGPPGERGRPRARDAARRCSRTRAPSGQTIHIGSQPFEVIGELEARGKFLGFNMDEIVAHPAHQPAQVLPQRPLVVPQARRGAAQRGGALARADGRRRSRRSATCCACAAACAPHQENDFAAMTDEALLGALQPDHRRLLRGDDRRRVPVAAGRRHRGDEHHAGLGHRADARDRRAQGARAPSARASCGSS